MLKMFIFGYVTFTSILIGYNQKFPHPQRAVEYFSRVAPIYYEYALVGMTASIINAMWKLIFEMNPKRRLIHGHTISVCAMSAAMDNLAFTPRPLYKEGGPSPQTTRKVLLREPLVGCITRCYLNHSDHYFIYNCATVLGFQRQRPKATLLLRIHFTIQEV